jgi:hypothetical protein
MREEGDEQVHGHVFLHQLQAEAHSCARAHTAVDALDRKQPTCVTRAVELDSKQAALLPGADLLSSASATAPRRQPTEPSLTFPVFVPHRHHRR